MKTVEIDLTGKIPDPPAFEDVYVFNDHPTAIDYARIVDADMKIVMFILQDGRTREETFHWVRGFEYALGISNALFPSIYIFEIPDGVDPKVWKVHQRDLLKVQYDSSLSWLPPIKERSDDHSLQDPIP